MAGRYIRGWVLFEMVVRKGREIGEGVDSFGFHDYFILGYYWTGFIGEGRYVVLKGILFLMKGGN